MATPRVGILPAADRRAIFEGAKSLDLDPYEFGGLLSLESGPNIDPNIVGGAGKKHRGMIQFGENEQKLYGITGPQTRAGQMAAVLKYFKDRGFKPGMGIDRAYATVLGGNPNVSLKAKDSFGTSVSGALPRFRKGGDLYANAQRVLGDPLDVGGQPSAAAPAPQLAGSAPVYGPTVEEAMGLQLMQQAMQGAPPPPNPAQKFANFLSTLGGIINPLTTPGY